MSLMELPNYQYNPKQFVECRHCGWKGILEQCKERRFQSPFDQTLSGRDGWIYKCPECDWIITSLWNKVS